MMKKEKDSKKKVLASLVMGLNCVNSFAPVALVAELPATRMDVNPTKEIAAEPEQYTAACYQALDVVDSAVFGTAEAAFAASVGTTTECDAVSVDGEMVDGTYTTDLDGHKTKVQRISAGGTATNGAIFSGGYQQVYSMGYAQVNSIGNSGFQLILSGGVGEVTLLDGAVGGSQQISQEGTGKITTLIAGQQRVRGISANGTIINMSGGSQIIQQFANGTVENMFGGVQNVVYAIGKVNVLNEGTQIVQQGGTGIVETMNGGEQYVSGSNDIGTIQAMNGGTQSVIEGISLDTYVKGGTIAVHSPTAVVSNATLESGNIIFNGGGDNYKLSGNFIGNGGTVDLTVTADGNKQIPATYETLTIENLFGNQTTFLMDTNLKSETDGDKIIVENAATVTGGVIQVYDKSLVDGTNLEGNKKLLLVTDNSGNSSWTGKSLDTGGLWTITPTIENEGNEWYLVLEEKAENPSTSPNPTAKTFSAFTDAAYGNWRTVLTDDTLRMRLGDLRYGDKEQGGVWARVKAGKLDAGNSEGSYQIYQVGIDKKVANTAYGLAIDHMTGKDTYELGSGKNSMTNLSLYATSYHPSGAYSDVVLKAGKYRGDVNTYSDNDSADYNSWAYSASYEVGKTISKSNGFFIEPEAQLVLGKLQGADYTSNNGIDANREGATSFLGRVGFVAGRKISDSGDYYFKANMWREFAGGGDVNLSAVNNYGDREYMTKSAGHKDTWFELGVGCNAKVGQNTYFYGDVLKTFGADIQKKWQANVGMRFAF